MTDTPARLVRLAQQLEDQHAPQHMTILMRNAAEEIDQLCANGCVVDKADAWDAIAAKNAEIERLRAALRDLITHTCNCERELTEDLYHAECCGESLPLTKARSALKEAP